MKQLTSVDVGDRARAVERIGTLWNYQYSVYDHLEENDKRYLKIALPKVQYGYVHISGQHSLNFPQSFLSRYLERLVRSLVYLLN